MNYSCKLDGYTWMMRRGNPKIYLSLLPAFPLESDSITILH